ncbi:16S rRNA (guanine(966)-N(2))-methyltransferase RsmD [Flavobacterium branchiophilum NBRC 15030 = ATCC 35035]|uniref:16S rRNA (Guanine(966)-N(2))-methyltransferase RsmD n=1 Tax=Flavobacterium branchiophilum TaxID=55197 RepID=A0A543G040_9FLAO|nr:RsmD family RNA methyltransferase [Flavobacterium branchiophilum]OXA70384.1 16S rRNA (guanine(966)-N(2))-methyltransferase RsmD [Flavobacterium branchiophilum NBRC 15030 = ATCC 35035]TQM39453.1 16S rRNA (guanine(966)-N(2))-methyltransferase RsmD [Flavobacterium branchiophilum]GEM55929.1 methyltransferase [Flavobacterium branchiophilum NBRC 15030 = ATCC 35035]
MRIISGKFKGRRLSPPKNLPVRPTTDMSKEALFNVLNNHFHFDELKILDLFAGTGNISYEFASRGSNNITSVDADFGCIKYIKQTTDEFDFDIAAVKSDVFAYIEKCKSTFDVIFADPPYALDQKIFEKLVVSIFDKAILDPEGMLVIEHSKHTTLNHLDHFSFQKNYGGSIFSFFEMVENEDIEAD